MEIATAAQMPTQQSNVHGEPRARLVRDLPASDLPHAALAVDLSEVTPIILKSPTLLADMDPYNSLKPTLKPEPPAEPEKEAAKSEKIDNAMNDSPAAPTPIGTTNSFGSGSARPVERPSATVAKSGGESSEQTTGVIPIRKAIPVEPHEKPIEIRRAVPVKPLDQESEDETLLKSAPPPSSDLDQ